MSTPHRGDHRGRLGVWDGVVDAAVRDYLSSLINERSQPGKGGMAVTSHDLMVAAKTVGQKCEYRVGVREAQGVAV